MSDSGITEADPGELWNSAAGVGNIGRTVDRYVQDFSEQMPSPPGIFGDEPDDGIAAVGIPALYEWIEAVKDCYQPVAVGAEGTCGDLQNTAEGFKIMNQNNSDMADEAASGLGDSISPASVAK
jgi:hypothetical protein